MRITLSTGTPAELTAAQEGVECLDVAAEAVVVRDGDLSIRARGRRAAAMPAHAGHERIEKLADYYGDARPNPDVPVSPA